MTALHAWDPVPEEDWEEFVELEGSSRDAVPDDQIDKTNKDQPPSPRDDDEISVTLLLSPDPDLEERRRSLRERAQERVPPGRRDPYASREEVIEANRPSGDAVLRAGVFAGRFGLTVVGPLRPPGLLTLRGSLANIKKAIRTDNDELIPLFQADDDGSYPIRQRKGPLRVPKPLAEVIDGLFGTDDRRQAKIKMHIKMHAGVQPEATVGLESESARMGVSQDGESLTPRNVAKLYGFPEGQDGRGQAIGVISLGGALDFNALARYFAHLPLPMTSITQLVVDGIPARLGREPLADQENQLDVQVAASIAPGAEIIVFSAPNTTAGYLEALAAAVYDQVNRPTVITCSWGLAEDFWTDQAMKAINRVLQDAASLGVTVCVASGDHGSWDVGSDDHTMRRADFPATSPYALACGGTQFELEKRQEEIRITDEVVWDEESSGRDGQPVRYASGGGVSRYFSSRPGWQDRIRVRERAGGEEPTAPEGRAVPDVAGSANPGYVLWFEDPANREQEWQCQRVAGGTSAVAPLWAGLIARINQELGRPVGYLNPFLYESVDQDQAFEDISRGNNGDYEARDGWDACTGLGRMRGQNLLDELR